MAYEKKSERILAGSLNLLPPGDLTPTGDSLRLLNWRPDQVGGLVTRRGHDFEASAAGFPHSAFRYDNNRYVGIGDALRYGNSLSLVDSGFDGTPLGFAAYQNLTFIMNRGQRRMVSGTNSTFWGVEAPLVACVAFDGGPGPLTGTFSYYVTYVNDRGYESSPSIVSNEITVTQGLVRLAVPISPDASVGMRRIYRVGGGVPAPMLITQLNNVDDDMVDAFSIDIQQGINTPIEFDNDLPPAAAGLLGPYFGRLVAWRSNFNKARLWWSKVGKPWAWPGSYELPPDLAALTFEGNWVDVGEGGEELIVCTHQRRSLWIYKQRSIWVLNGDPDENDPERVVASVGVLSPNGVCSANGIDYFIGPDGIYTFNGFREERISSKVAPLFRGEFVKVGLFTVAGVDLDRLSQACIEHREGKLFFSYRSMVAASGENDTTLVYDLESGNWATMEHDPSLGNSGFTFLYNEGPGTQFGLLGGVASAGTGKVFVVGGGSQSDGGQAIPVAWQSRYFDAGLPDHDKTFQDLTVEYSTTDATDQNPSTHFLTLYVITDNGTQELAIGNLQSATRTRTVFRLGAVDGLGLTARNLAVVISGNTKGTARIFSVTLNYYVLPRVARHFDSGVITGPMRDEQALELDIEVFGALATATVSSDGAGTMVQVGTKNIAAGARRVLTIQEPGFLTSGPARQYRIQVLAAAGSSFRLWGCRLGGFEVSAAIRDVEEWVSEPILL